MRRSALILSLAWVLAARTARADELVVPELAPPPAPARWAVDVDDARAIGDDVLAPSSQALILSARGPSGRPWVASIELGVLVWRDATTGADGTTTTDRGVMPVSPTLGIARWFGPRRDGGVQLVLRTALTLPLGGADRDPPPSMQLRVTAGPWARTGPADLKLAVGARYRASDALAVQVEAGADLGVSSGEHASWAHGLAWVGGGLAVRATGSLALGVHALARWLPKASPWRRDDEGAVVGLGGSHAWGGGDLGVRAELRVDGCPLTTDGGLTTREVFCSRLVVGYGRTFGR